VGLPPEAETFDKPEVWEGGTTNASYSVPAGSGGAIICDTGALLDYV